ncbi:uncharacterized protein LOC128262218 [Drosophila gunungcola]|uniref:uncharacterized protein LOC128262218 n=1 Tax=Drosophila gunungcola TaxID=103775 RepID=UPI0022E8E3DF|nr:uncharacterized protein LOC128262218 [Drosophila gunungcola]
MNSENYIIPHDWMFYSDIVVKTEFKLYNIMPANNFQSRIVHRCQRLKIAGYIINTLDGKRAFGVMEGQRENINKIKDWILRCCIPEPFHRRIIFSAYEFSYNPSSEPFHQRENAPKGAKFLGDLDESCFDEFEFVEVPLKGDDDPNESLGEYADFYTKNNSNFGSAETTSETITPIQSYDETTTSGDDVVYTATKPTLPADDSS